MAFPIRFPVTGLLIATFLLSGTALAQNNTGGSLETNIALSSRGAETTALNYGTFSGNRRVASKANDGDLSTAWGGTWTQNNQPNWLRIRLARTAHVRAVRVHLGTHSLVYRLEGSVDGNSWTTLVGPTRHEEGTAQTYDVPSSRARFIRLVCLQTSAPSSHIWQYIVKELKVYGGKKKSEPAILSLNASPNPVKTGEEVRFSANVQNAAEYRWNFGDGSTASGLATTHVYEEPGQYQVDLLAKSAGGRDQRSVSIKVQSYGESESAFLFTDAFNERSFKRKWRITEQDDETIRQMDGYLLHDSPKTYNKGGNMVSANRFPASGTVTISVRQRQANTDYWGNGIRVQFRDGFIQLKEQKWGKNEALELRVKGDAIPDRYEKLAPPTSSSSWMVYELTIDFSEQRITSVAREGETYDVDLSISGIVEDTFKFVIGVGRGHRVLYDNVKISQVEPGDTLAQVYTVKVSQEDGRPVSDAKVTIFTGSDRSDVKTTGRGGTAEFQVQGYIKRIFAYHGSGRFAPQVRQINYSSSTYNVKLQENPTPQNFQSALNQTLDAIWTVKGIWDLVSFATKSSAALPVTGIPGILDAKPVVKDDDLYMKVSGPMVRLMERIFSKVPGSCLSRYRGKWCVTSSESL